MTTAPHTHGHEVAGKIALDAEGLRQNLRMILAHLFDLHLLGSQAYGHQNVASTLQLQLDNVVQTAREATNTLAERLRALDAMSVRFSTTASTTTVPATRRLERNSAAMLDRIAHRIITLVDIIGCVQERVDAADTSTGDLLRAIMDSFAEQVSTLEFHTLKT